MRGAGNASDDGYEGDEGPHPQQACPPEAGAVARHLCQAPGAVGAAAHLRALAFDGLLANATDDPIHGDTSSLRGCWC
jgi:hypothetical protein